MLAPMTL